jgi:hypothetical protein
MRPLPYVLIFSLLGVPAAAAKASPRQQAKHAKIVKAKPAKPDKAKKAKHVDDGRRAELYAFPSRDAQIIRDYYEPRYRNLPPGLQKKLYRTGQLPPGWQKKLHPLPVEVERRLAPIPSVYRRGVIDDYVVVVDPRRQLILDLIPAFVRR